MPKKIQSVINALFVVTQTTRNFEVSEQISKIFGIIDTFSVISENIQHNVKKTNHMKA